jgi:hypothetical protein
MQAFEQHGWRPLTRQQSGRKARQQLLSEALAKGSLGFCNKMSLGDAPVAMSDYMSSAAVRPLMAAFVSGFKVFSVDEFETFFGVASTNLTK